MTTLTRPAQKKKIILKFNQALLHLEKTHFKNYLKHIFEYNDESGLILRQNQKIGKHIYSLVTRSEFPKNPKLSDNCIILNLPRTHHKEWYENKFIHFDSYAQAQINSYLDAHFHLEFHTFMLMNANNYGTRKEAILAFRDSYSLSEDDILLSNLLKSDQRFRQKVGFIA